MKTIPAKKNVLQWSRTYHHHLPFTFGLLHARVQRGFERKYYSGTRYNYGSPLEFYFGCK